MKGQFLDAKNRKEKKENEHFQNVIIWFPSHIRACPPLYHHHLSLSFSLSLRSDLPSLACCQLKDVSPPHARFYLKKKKNQSISIKKNNKSNFFFSSQGLSGNGGKPGPLSSPRLIACSMTIEMERGENLRLY